MQKSQARHSSWQELLRSPAPSSHIVQLYDNDDFLAKAVAHFAAEGLRGGEAVLLTGTPAHLRGVLRDLALRDVDADAAQRDGRLSVSDVHEAVATVCRDGKLDHAAFRDLAGSAIGRARAGARCSGVRWWGEISHVLEKQGNMRAALEAENLGDAAARKHEIGLLCSYPCDNFDPSGYDGRLHTLCDKHSHLIPAQDYVRHRMAVNRAMAEVVGDIKGPLLQSLMSWKGLHCDLPSSQAILFWIREAMPEHFADILKRAKSYQATTPIDDGDAEQPA